MQLYKSLYISVFVRTHSINCESTPSFMHLAPGVGRYLEMGDISKWYQRPSPDRGGNGQNQQKAGSSATTCPSLLNQSVFGRMNRTANTQLC